MRQSSSPNHLVYARKAQGPDSQISARSDRQGVVMSISLSDSNETFEGRHTPYALKFTLETSMRMVISDLVKSDRVFYI
jgi:hypothetical protein